MTIICPKCNGKKYIFDALSLLLTIGLPLAMLVEQGQEDGITKMKYPTCKGKGIIKYE